MADWLVPLSSHTRFVDRDSRPVTPRFEPVRGAALNGQRVSVAAEVRGPLTDVQTGDTIWLLWTERDVGVMAVGRARTPHTRRSRAPELPVVLEQARPPALVVDPMPSGVIRRWLPDVRSSGPSRWICTRGPGGPSGVGEGTPRARRGAPPAGRRPDLASESRAWPR